MFNEAQAKSQPGKIDIGFPFVLVNSGEKCEVKTMVDK